MNEANQGNNPDALAIVPLKRKRGRPRKYPKPDPDGKNAHVHVPRDQNLNPGENAHAPPGFGKVNGNQSYHADPVNDAVDPMIGQAVCGVIEATFDAGFLLNVRVGNSETTLRGVVFKPGHYIPVMPGNDIAPSVPMIRRNEIPVPRETNTQVHSHNPEPRDRNGTAHAARAANPVGSKGKQVLSGMSQTPAISRGNIVPVVLQPVNLSNGVPAASEPAATTQAAHLWPSKGKQVLDAAHPSNGSTPIDQFQHSQTQNNHQSRPPGMQSESDPSIQNPADGLHETEANSMKTTGVPFEKLLTEVIKRVNAPSQPAETNSNSAIKVPVKDTGNVAESTTSYTAQPISVEPLQVLQPNIGSHPAVSSRPSEDYRTGKMTQLLQENMTDNQVTRTEELAAGSRLN